jgi:spore maturation protein CgeB
VRVLIVGEYQWFWYEKAFENDFSSFGHEVKSFKTIDYFKLFKDNEPEPVFKSKYREVGYRIKWGPLINRLNRDLIDTVFSFKPDAILFYRPVHIYPETLKKIKEKTDVKMVSYFNDDPFSGNSSAFKWRHFINSIKIFDINYIVRKKNETEFDKLNSNKTEFLGHFYVSDIHYKSGSDTKNNDVIFAGHYENDFRLDCIENLLNDGVNLSLYGGGWNNFLSNSNKDLSIKKFYPVHPLIGEDYRDKIARSKIALCFLSKLNNDDSTSRNFEIPAIGTFMLTEYSDLLAEIFKEDVEAGFFKSSEELSDKINFYLKNDDIREKIALKGHEKVKSGKFSSASKVEQVLSDLKKYYGIS